jgi:hypothetical protein
VDPSTQVVNRVIHQQTNFLNSTELFYWRALSQLSAVSTRTKDADYFVFDNLLRESAAKDLLILLLYSTIWFDVSNGYALFSHYDDGLWFPIISSFAQVFF